VSHRRLPPPRHRAAWIGCRRNVYGLQEYAYFADEVTAEEHLAACVQLAILDPCGGLIAS
jgi:hypothetical protein